ncbi:hypothetical protein Plhal304r1_c076g0163801 [Plasmopara halstedii]
MRQTPSITTAYTNTASARNPSSPILERFGDDYLPIFFHHPASSRFPVIKLAPENDLTTLCPDETPNNSPQIFAESDVLSALTSCYPIFECLRSLQINIAL